MFKPLTLTRSLASLSPLGRGDPDGEISRILRDSDAGEVIGPGGDEELAGVIVRLREEPKEAARMGANAWRIFEARFDKAIGLGKWGEVLGSPGGGKR